VVLIRAPGLGALIDNDIDKASSCTLKCVYRTKDRFCLFLF
jgi:hypothetical protein